MKMCSQSRDCFFHMEDVQFYILNMENTKYKRNVLIASTKTNNILGAAFILFPRVLSVEKIKVQTNTRD